MAAAAAGRLLVRDRPANARAAADRRDAVRRAGQRHHGAGRVTESRHPRSGDGDRGHARSGGASEQPRLRGHPPDVARIPREWAADGPLRFAVPARAVADAVRDLDTLADARAIVGSAVQKSRCTIEQLTDELTSGQIRGSARLRAVLAEVADGARSAAEGDFRALVRRSALPPPLFNARLSCGRCAARRRGCLVARSRVLAVEIDSREWHFLAHGRTRCAATTG